MLDEKERICNPDGKWKYDHSSSWVFYEWDMLSDLDDIYDISEIETVYKIVKCIDTFIWFNCEGDW